MGIQTVQSNHKKKVIINCDVTFVEDEECQWNAAAEMD